jgi:hypothetical protein
VPDALVMLPSVTTPVSSAMSACGTLKVEAGAVFTPHSAASVTNGFEPRVHRL